MSLNRILKNSQFLQLIRNTQIHFLQKMLKNGFWNEIPSNVNTKKKIIPRQIITRFLRTVIKRKSKTHALRKYSGKEE